MSEWNTFGLCNFDMDNKRKIVHFFLLGFLLSFLLNATGNKGFYKNSELDPAAQHEYQIAPSNPFSGLQIIAPAGIEEPFHAFPSTPEVKEEIEEEDSRSSADLVGLFELDNDIQRVSTRALEAFSALFQSKLYLLFHQLKINC